MECICQADCFIHGRRYRPGQKDEFVKCPKHFKSVAQVAKENKVLVEASKSEEDRLRERVTDLEEQVKALETENADLRKVVDGKSD